VIAIGFGHGSQQQRLRIATYTPATAAPTIAAISTASTMALVHIGSLEARLEPIRCVSVGKAVPLIGHQARRAKGHTEQRHEQVNAAVEAVQPEL
jgi:hypothetical protein